MAAAEATVSVRELRRDPDATLLRLSALGDLVWVQAGRQRFLLVSGEDEVRETLVERSAELVKPRSQAIAVGRPAPEPEEARVSPTRLRRALTQGMGADAATETAARLVAEVDAAAASWRAGDSVQVMPWLRPIVTRAVVHGAFASSLTERDEERLASVIRSADRAPRVARRGPTPHGLARSLAFARLSVVVRSLLANVDLSRPSELSALLEHEEFASSLSDLERQALAGELLLGAVGPLVQTGGWLLLRLGTEPEAVARLRAEWDAGPERAYTDAFVREVTRLHPTNPYITRVARRETTVGGEAVPEPTRVVVNVAALQCHAGLYQEPERFRPERWLEGRGPEHRFSYAAFGIGDRRCLGETIATTALAALLESVGRGLELAFGSVEVAARGRRQLADTVAVTVRRRQAP